MDQNRAPIYEALEEFRNERIVPLTYRGINEAGETKP